MPSKCHYTILEVMHLQESEENIMYPKLIKSVFLILVVVVLVCCIYVSFSNKNGARIQALHVVLANDQRPDEKSHSGEKDVRPNGTSGRVVKQSEDIVSQAGNVEYKHMKCLQKLAETTVDMLIASRSIISLNQELINRDPATGNYSFKGFVPAVAGSQIANSFSLMTGHSLKQTSLKLRNPSNAPDEWEMKVLKLFGSLEYPRDVGFGEILGINDKKIYRYMKPIYVEKACLQCHGKREKIRPEIRQFLEMRYPYDVAFGYKEGELRGGISITLSMERLGFEK